MESVFRKVEGELEGLFGGEKHSHTHNGAQCHQHHPQNHSSNRYQSFAPQTTGGAKWYVDGASYFWAVSEAIEQAQESIYILDWWLSPEIYLRRPPSGNEQYRLDNMLKAAAERGVKINVIVYKEVEQALTLKSIHTKRALEALNPNIRVFRHPDHVLSSSDIASDITSSFSNLTLSTFNLSKVSSDALKTIYGTSDDVVLFWAHHEKLCVIDRKIAFMGGLDLCFGRWDTNSHPIADAHPLNLDAIVFPGQDYNNVRIMDFNDVENWDQNKLDRTKSSRMGWSDVSLSLDGPIVQSLVSHFTDRWNYIFNQKYKTQDPGKYQMMDTVAPLGDASGEDDSRWHGTAFGRMPTMSGMVNMGDTFFGELHDHFSKRWDHLLGQEEDDFGEERHHQLGPFPVHIQLTRSCTVWSSGHPTEHSVANAYISAIANARHFVYIENQFFITATSDSQHPVTNKIGGAIVERIVRAFQDNQDFRIIVAIPAVPGFPGDLKANDSLGTRAIMEYQYNSINRGGHSIIQLLQKAGIEDPSQYIGFYNLRNFDRIDASSTMAAAEQQSGVSYEAARKEHDDIVGAGYYPSGEGTNAQQGQQDTQYERYQAAAAKMQDRTWDSVAACYMDAGPDLNSIPWDGPPESEIDAYVSEELYIHTKLLIADDRLVICGSANLNDRSQLGTHDSEIAVVIEDPTPVRSQMCGRPYVASRFAASLRRQIFRKHLGLLPHQPIHTPGPNWTPVTAELNEYDWDSPADTLVQDPMSRNFHNLWTGTARDNTEVFSKVFHNVPNDKVSTWDDYDKFFSRYFYPPGAKPKDEKEAAGKVEYGHVVKEEFPGGVKEVKEWLGRVRGNLVEMPLQFLVDVKDLAKEGLSLNSFTDEIYT